MPFICTSFPHCTQAGRGCLKTNIILRLESYLKATFEKITVNYIFLCDKQKCKDDSIVVSLLLPRDCIDLDMLCNIKKAYYFLNH